MPDRFSRRERRVRAILRGLLGLYPASFRETLGDDLVETTLERWRDDVRGGIGARFRFWLVAVVRFAVDGVLERFHGLGGIGSDLRGALRLVRRAPGFHGLAVATIALGIGATTAMFAVVDGVVLRPLPYEGADELVLIHARFGNFTFSSNSLANLQDIRASASSFRWLAGARDWSPSLSAGGDPQRANALVVTEDWHSGLGARARAGRLLDAADFAPEADRVAVISHATWRTLLGGRDVLGEPIVLEGVRRTIVGVMDASYRDPEPVESGPPVAVWVPARAGDPEWCNAPRESCYESRDDYAFRVLGRLAESASLESANRQLTAIGARLGEAYPDANRMGDGVLDFVLLPLKQQTVGEARDRLLLLLGASALLLLLACANVANLFLARSSARGAELSLRAALGAGRGRIVRQLFTESAVVALLGGAVGALLGAAGLRAFVVLSPGAIPRLWETGFDLRIALFVAGLAGLTAVAFGLVPALRAARALDAVVREPRASASRRGRRAQSALVAAEVALALVLVVGSALLLRSFALLVRVDPGFDARDLLLVDVRAPARSAGIAASRRFYEELLTRARALPGVQSAALSYSAPGAAGGSFTRVTPEGDAPAEVAESFYRFNPVTDDWFATLGVALRSGSLFREDGRAAQVVLLNEAAAKAFFPNDPSPVGRRLKLGSADSDAPLSEVIGVVADVRRRLTEDPDPEIFVPWAEHGMPRMLVMLKLQVGVEPPAGALRAAVREIAPDLPVDRVATMRERLQETTREARFLTSLVTAFASLALLLAAVGTFAAASHAASRRRREVGIRMALGAKPSSVFRLVVSGNAVAAATGLLAGLALTFALSRFLEAYLFGITVHDPATVALACTIIAGSALLAAASPALRATRVDPNEVLRSD